MIGCLKLDSDNVEENIKKTAQCMPAAPIIWSGDYVNQNDSSIVLSVDVKSEGTGGPCNVQYSYLVELDSKSNYKHAMKEAFVDKGMLIVKSKICLPTPCPPPPHPDGFSCTPSCVDYEYEIDPLNMYGENIEIQVTSSVIELEGIYSKN